VHVIDPSTAPPSLPSAGSGQIRLARRDKSSWRQRQEILAAANSAWVTNQVNSEAWSQL